MKIVFLKAIPSLIALTFLTAFTPTSIEQPISTPAEHATHSLSDNALHVAFDFNGVTATTNTYKVVADDLGLSSIAKYAVTTGKSPSNLHSLMFKILSKIPTDSAKCNACDPDGVPLPNILCDWQRGTQSPAQIHAQVFDVIKNNPQLFANEIEQLLIKRLAHMMFTPKRLAHIQQLVPDTKKLIQECINKGHHVYILSNYDSKTFAIIRNSPQFKDLFKLFKPENIIVSSHLGCMKPEKAIYTAFQEKFPHIDPRNIVLIDDQQENIDAAHESGWHGILCPTKKGIFNFISKRPDINIVRAQLNAIEERVALLHGTAHVTPLTL